jgi:hypothetical protein
MDDPETKPWTHFDEENLLLEVSEDRRLRRLGIDPDEHPLLILLELRKRKEAIDAGAKNARG